MATLMVTTKRTKNKNKKWKIKIYRTQTFSFGIFKMFFILNNRIFDFFFLNRELISANQIQLYLRFGMVLRMLNSNCILQRFKILWLKVSKIYESRDQIFFLFVSALFARYLFFFATSQQPLKVPRMKLELVGSYERSYGQQSSLLLSH